MNTFKPTIPKRITFMIKSFIMLCGVFIIITSLVHRLSPIENFYFATFLIIVLPLAISVLYGIIRPTIIDVSNEKVTVRNVIRQRNFLLSEYNITSYISSGGRLGIFSGLFLVLTNSYGRLGFFSSIFLVFTDKLNPKKKIKIKLIGLNKKTFTSLMNEIALVQYSEEDSHLESKSSEVNTTYSEIFKHSIDPHKVKTKLSVYLAPYMIPVIISLLFGMLVGWDFTFSNLSMYMCLFIFYTVPSLIISKYKQKFFITYIEMGSEYLKLETNKKKYEYEWNSVESIQLTLPDYSGIGDRAIFINKADSKDTFYLGKRFNSKLKEDYLLLDKNLRKYSTKTTTYLFK